MLFVSSGFRYGEPTQRQHQLSAWRKKICLVMVYYNLSYHRVWMAWNQRIGAPYSNAFLSAEKAPEGV